MISGAVAGAIVDGIVALTVASGGTATPGLLAAAGAIGSASGEKVHQMLTGRDDPAAIAKAGLFGMAGGIAAGMMPALSRALTPSGKSLKLFVGEPTQVIDDAAKTGTTAFRSFTASNFRTNLGRLTGNVPANSQAHHVFPQKFQSIFSSKGIIIHDPKFGAWWNSSGHLKNASGYNAAWESFLKTNPSQSQIMNYGRQLMGQYGIPVGF